MIKDKILGEICKTFKIKNDFIASEKYRHEQREKNGVRKNKIHRYLEF